MKSAHLTGRTQTMIKYLAAFALMVAATGLPVEASAVPPGHAPVAPSIRARAHRTTGSIREIGRNSVLQRPGQRYLATAHGQEVRQLVSEYHATSATMTPRERVLTLRAIVRTMDAANVVRPHTHSPAARAEVVRLLTDANADWTVQGPRTTR